MQRKNEMIYSSEDWDSESHSTSQEEVGAAETVAGLVVVGGVHVL